MKHAKILLVALIGLLLVACQKDKSKEKVEETTAAPTTTLQETTKEETSDEANKAKDVTFTFYVHGESLGEFVVKDAVGKSVKEAMESNEKIVFKFNEAEGIIDSIMDYTNKPADGIYWSYLLNDQFAEKGVVSQKLEAGDKIDWHYGTEDEIPNKIIPESTSEEATLEESTEESQTESE